MKQLQITEIGSLWGRTRTKQGNTGKLNVQFGAPGYRSCFAIQMLWGPSLGGALAVLGRSPSVPLLRYQRPWCVVPMGHCT